MPKSIIGRFAPSPTGELHLGSLTTAIASYCHIKSLQGQWLLRIEDTDTQRCSQHFSDKILLDLERLGLYWDNSVIYQSQRKRLYNELLYDKLIHRIYACHCSRKQLHGYLIYPRFCLPAGNALSISSNHQHLENQKIRVQLPDYQIGFLDQLQGMQWANPQASLGDVVLRRADGIINYFLAVSIDDGLQGVTHVMRGLDILPLTTAQIALMHYLDVPNIEHWYHLPLVKNHQGQKLSKQTLATPIDTSDHTKCQSLIHQALKLLKQPMVASDTPEKMLLQAISQWDNEPLKHQQTLNKI